MFPHVTSWPTTSSALCGCPGNRYRLIPTGPQVSFLLGELVLDIIDRGLLSEDVVFVRWADDYRLFARSEREAAKILALLARLLFDTHGLTLQARKTQIFTAAAFTLRQGREADTERSRLAEEYAALIDELGIATGFYEQIAIEDLTPDQREALDGLNLIGIIDEQLGNLNALDQPLFQFVLWRLSQLGNGAALERLIDNAEALYPVFMEVLKYAASVEISDNEQRSRIDNKLSLLIGSSRIGDSEYLRTWIMSILSSPGHSVPTKRLIEIFNSYPDELTQREVILALGRGHAVSWIKPRKPEIGQFSPWRKRAFLAAASSLPGDEAPHWYRSLSPGLSVLEKAIKDWALQNRF